MLYTSWASNGREEMQEESNYHWEQQWNNEVVIMNYSEIIKN